MKCEGPVVGHYSSENENENEICDIARMVEWLKTRRLSRRSPGSAGSNPAPRIFFDFYCCCADMAQLEARCADNAEVFGSIPNIRINWCLCF